VKLIYKLIKFQAVFTVDKFKLWIAVVN